MKNKELKIEVPEGYIIDKENSTFECIKFKPNKRLTYEDVTKALFGEGAYYTDIEGEIVHCDLPSYSPNSATSIKQLEKLLAINKLMNVAKYLNGNWEPNWYDEEQPKFYLGIGENGNIAVGDANNFNGALVYFRHPDIAEQAVDILGERTIHLALSTEW